MVVSKYIFLSVEQQRLILAMFNDGGRMSYKKQDVYKSERAFQKALNILVEASAVDLIINDDYYNEYVLTKEGRWLCEHGVIPLKKM